ncbi:MAG: hypothetical protein EBR29_09000 [Sphingobacteriia bacterium]|nr:hypothetical protein [Sphingobacteriia bacterium]
MGAGVLLRPEADGCHGRDEFSTTGMGNGPGKDPKARRQRFPQTSKMWFGNPSGFFQENSTVSDGLKNRDR